MHARPLCPSSLQGVGSLFANPAQLSQKEGGRRNAVYASTWDITGQVRPRPSTPEGNQRGELAQSDHSLGEFWVWEGRRRVVWIYPIALGQVEAGGVPGGTVHEHP